MFGERTSRMHIRIGGESLHMYMPVLMAEGLHACVYTCLWHPEVNLRCWGFCLFAFLCMHNEGAPRHHTGAPGPLLYLKPRGELVRSRAPRIRSPSSGSRSRETLRVSGSSLRLAPRTSRSAAQTGVEGEGTKRPGRGKAGCQSCEVLRAAEPGTEEPPAARLSAGA